jgi:serine/threonine-protein kinase
MSTSGPRLETDRYQLEREVGAGAIATVWRARDLETGCDVAIKVLRSEIDLEDVQRLAQEVEILRRLSHPCIVKPFATGVAEEGNPYVVMEWVEGIDLRERLDRTPVLPPADVADIVNQTCSALSEAHGAGVIHRDLKPENVLLCAPEHLAVKLVDFGMAKVLSPDAPSLTVDGKVFGTPEYMAPERARGRPVQSAADIYGLAVMAYEMLEGRRPFGGKNPIQVMTRQIARPPPPMSRVAPEIAQAVLAGLAKESAARPDAASFARMLDLAIRQGASNQRSTGETGEQV